MLIGVFESEREDVTGGWFYRICGIITFPGLQQGDCMDRTCSIHRKPRDVKSYIKMFSRKL